MESTELEKLERIARNLPCRYIEMERCDGIHGEIYFAYGTDDTGQVHGVWGHCGLAMTVDFINGVTLDQVRQALVDSAHREVSAVFYA